MNCSLLKKLKKIITFFQIHLKNYIKIRHLEAKSLYFEKKLIKGDENLFFSPEIPEI